MWIIWLASLAEAACPAVLHADELSARVTALVEPVAFAEDSAELELLAIEGALAEGCVEMTVPKETLGALFMAQGAYALLRGEAPAKAELYLKRAAAIGAAIEPSYGPTVETAYRRASNSLQGDAVIELSFPKPPDLVVVDGELIYDADERRVLLGAHLVQWYDAGQDRWFAEWVVLEEWGERRLIGGGPPLGDELPGASPAPVEAAPSRRALPPTQLRLDAGVGGMSLTSHPAEGAGGFEGQTAGGILRGGLRVGDSVWVQASGQLSVSPTTLSTEYGELGVPTLPSDARLTVGRGGSWLSAELGVLISTQPTVTETELPISEDQSLKLFGVSAYETAVLADVRRAVGGGGVVQVHAAWGETLQVGASLLGAATVNGASGGMLQAGVELWGGVPLGPITAVGGVNGRLFHCVAGGDEHIVNESLLSVSGGVVWSL
ncbi:MAG: hypothetical protein IPN01_17135 [Deltaproteobacteria bacterium]|nr:hypothetical protein [Deltaproteobacteria bacterium]